MNEADTEAKECLLELGKAKRMLAELLAPALPDDEPGLELRGTIDALQFVESAARRSRLMLMRRLVQSFKEGEGDDR